MEPSTLGAAIAVSECVPTWIWKTFPYGAYLKKDDLETSPGTLFSSESF